MSPVRIDTVAKHLRLSSPSSAALSSLIEHVAVIISLFLRSHFFLSMSMHLSFQASFSSLCLY